MRRVIREEEPPKPSTRLSTLQKIDLKTVATSRHSEAAKLTSLIRGDLDWIVMKALEKNRNCRYDTANAFADDIQRHLASEPVIARSPSTAYLLQKLVHRHRTAFAAGSAVVLALLARIAVAGWQAARANMALEELRDAAPVFTAHARALMTEQNLEEALLAINYAKSLTPNDATTNGAIVHQLRGDIFQALLRLPEAAEEYQTVLKHRPNSQHAAENAELANSLLKATRDNPIGNELLLDLNKNLLKQGRTAEAVAVAQGQLRNAYPSSEIDVRISDGLFAVDLSGKDVDNLEDLKGMPLRILTLHLTKVRLLKPLLECPTLEELTIPDQAEDVEALRSITTLRRLSFSNKLTTSEQGYATAGQTVAEFWKAYDEKMAARAQ